MRMTSPLRGGRFIGWSTDTTRGIAMEKIKLVIASVILAAGLVVLAVVIGIGWMASKVATWSMERLHKKEEAVTLPEPVHQQILS